MSSPAADLIRQQTLSQQPQCRQGEGFADSLEGTQDDGYLQGRAVPYGHTIMLMPGLYERFEYGACKRQVSDPGRVKVCLEHGQIVGSMSSLTEAEDGLYFRGRVSDSHDIPEARRARALVSEGLLDELSVGFNTVAGGTQVIDQEDGSTLFVHTRVRLMEVSLVPWGAYGREATLQRSRLVDPVALRLEAARAQARQWLADYRARMG